MDAFRLILRADLRRGWRPMLMLALLLAVTGGVVLTAATGAERTSTAYPRMLQWAQASQLDLVSDAGTSAAFYRQLRALPGVASVSRASYYDTLLSAGGGRAPIPVTTWASPDGTMGVTADRVKVLAGRPFAPPAAARSAMVDPQLAARDHLRPGSALRLLVVPSSAAGISEPQRAVPMTFRVTAIVVLDNGVVPADAVAAQPTALLSPDFTRTPAARAASFGDQAAVRLRPGASRPRFVRAAAALARRYRSTNGLNVVDLADQVTATERAIRPQAVALAVFAAAAGLIALAVLGQLLARQLTLDAAGFPALRALGVTRAGLTALSMARLACVTVAGGILAGATAVAASPLMPVGPARLAEPRPGVALTPAILGPGVALLVALPLALLAPVAWRVAGRGGPPVDRAPARSSRGSRDGPGAGAGWLGALTPALPPAAAIGVRMALEPGRGRTAVPVRSALAAMVVATAAVVAAIVFGASLLHLISTPRLYGQDWQQELDLGFGGIPRPLVARLMTSQPRLAGYAAGNYGQISLDGLVVPAIGLDPVRGAGYLTLLAGRAPARPDEIALGAQTLQDVHARLGQRVQVVIHGRPRRMRITGVTVLARFGLGTVVTTDLGSGAVVTAPVLSTPAPQSGCPARLTCYNFMLVRYQAGTGMRAAATRLGQTIARLCPPQACTVTADQRPGEIRHYTSVRDTPTVLGALLALLAAGTLSHVLLTSVRRRRRDFAVLRVLGLVRAQVLAVVTWQGLTVAMIALLAGIPLGLLAGRWAWVLFAGEAGVWPGATIPAPLVLLAIPLTLALAAALAVWPGRAAVRARPAAALRAE
jgi:hypothetical protein